jgi:hypothetical protein
MLLHHLQCITKLVQLGFALLVGKQTGLDLENLRQVRGANIMQDAKRFFEVPCSCIIIKYAPQVGCDLEQSTARARQ